MRRSRFTDAQIVAIIREYDAGASPAELARRHGVHADPIRLWKAEYARVDVSDVGLKQLEAENAQMHRIIARLTLKADAMEDLIRKTDEAFTAGRNGQGVTAIGAKPVRRLQDHSRAAAITAGTSQREEAGRRSSHRPSYGTRGGVAAPRLPVVVTIGTSAKGRMEMPIWTSNAFPGSSGSGTCS